MTARRLGGSANASPPTAVGSTWPAAVPRSRSRSATEARRGARARPAAAASGRPSAACTAMFSESAAATSRVERRGTRARRWSRSAFHSTMATSRPRGRPAGPSLPRAAPLRRERACTLRSARDHSSMSARACAGESGSDSTSRAARSATGSSGSGKRSRYQVSRVHGQEVQARADALGRRAPWYSSRSPPAAPGRCVPRRGGGRRRRRGQRGERRDPASPRGPRRSGRPGAARRRGAGRAGAAGTSATPACRSERLSLYPGSTTS